MSDDPFHGRGFSRDVIDGEEAARHRHMLAEIESQWLTISDAVTVARAFAIIATILKVGGPVLLAAIGAGAFAKTQGWL